MRASTKRKRGRTTRSVSRCEVYRFALQYAPVV